MVRRKLHHWLIGVAIIVSAIVSMAFMSLGENLVYFYTPAEAYAKANSLAGQTIKVGGMVKPGSVEWKPEQLSLAFTVSDMKGRDIGVRHTGTPPDMFKEGQGVVVEGRITADGSNMASRNLMVKHSEEYTKPGDHASMDRALLERSLFKE